MGGHRVLITGIGSELASLFAEQLEQRDDVEYLAGVDVREPQRALTRTEFVRADIRNPLVARIIGATEVDTVVHLAVSPYPGLAGGRAKMKEQNVIGSMQLLGACQKSESLRALVVKSSTAVYGSDHTDPALFGEDVSPRIPPRSGYAKDVSEVEGYVRAFARRRPDVTTTILRFANFLGGELRSLFSRYFALPVVPTVLGFDPRLQFLHTDDALEVLVRATVEDHPGVYNVAGPGIMYLSQAVRRAGRVPAPVPSPFVDLAGSLLQRSRRVDYSPEQLRMLQYGRVADITRLREKFGFEPRYSTRAAFDDYVARRRIRSVSEGDQRGDWERDLYDFIARKGRERVHAGAAVDGEET